MHGRSLLTTIVVVLSSLTLSHQQKQLYTEDTYTIEDELDATKFGQCPVPVICKVPNVKQCGIPAPDNSGDIYVDCSSREVGPYMPGFTYYVISRRTWQFDFSDNGITSLDDYSFLTDSEVPVNLTALNLSHNFIRYIDPKTFTGNISSALHTLDLSHNRLIELKDGVFSQMPSLRSLKLNNNLLLSMDSVCGTPFPALTSLSLQYNRISKLSQGCMKDARNRVNVDLSYNYLGSLDTCSVSSQMTAVVRGNPILCGCQQVDTCYAFSDASDVASVSQQTSTCSSSTCHNMSYSVKYERVDSDPSAKYSLVVKLPGDAPYNIDVLQFTGLQNETALNITRVARNTGVSEVYKHKLDYGQDYSVCATLASDSEAKQRTCTYLNPPQFRASSSPQLVYGSLLTVVISVFTTIYLS